MKKILSLLLLALLSVTQAMAYDFEVGGIYYTKSGLSATVTYKDDNYNSYSGDVVIPETVTYGDVTYNVTQIGKNAFRNCSSLTNITIPESVTSIGGYAFQNCSNLMEINIPESITKIERGTFGGCSSLEAITLNGVCSILEMFGTDSYPGSYSSYDYTSSRSYYIPRSLKKVTFTGNSITNISCKGCISITNVEISNTVTTIASQAFYNCSGLETISIPANIRLISYNAFYGCENLRIAKFASLRSLAQIEFGEYANPMTLTHRLYFADSDDEITEIDFPEDLEIIKNGAFDGCSNLTRISIPEGVTSIGSYAFQDCSRISSLTLPNSLTNIGANAFKNCTGLRNITLNKNFTDKFTDYNYTWHFTSVDVPELASSSTISNKSLILVPAESLDAYKSAEYWKDHASQIIADNAESNYNVTITADPLLSDLLRKVGEQNLNNVVSLKVSGTMNGYDMMIIRNKMPNLKHLDLSDVDIETLFDYEYSVGNSSVGHILTKDWLPKGLNSLSLPKSITCINTNALEGLNLLEELTIPSGVTTINPYAFLNCSGLKSILIPDGVEFIGFGVLSGCSGLESVTIPFVGASGYDSKDSRSHVFGAIFGDKQYNGSYQAQQKTSTSSYYPAYIPSNLKQVTVTGGDELLYAFAGCYNLTSIILPETLTTIGDYSFYGNRFTNIDIPKSVQFIGERAFASCSYLTNITIPQGVKTIGLSAFSGCYNLTNIIIPEGVENISQSAFENCSGLTSLTIPYSVNFIGNNAFQGCSKLVSCLLPRISSLTTIPQYAFKGCSALERMDLPVSVTKIENYAFQNCTSLTEVRIPSGMRSIGNYAFDGCTKLYDVYTYTVEPQDIQQQTFSTNSYNNGTLHCPKVSYYNYYFATPWNQFLNLTAFDEPYEYVYINKDFSIMNDVVSGDPEFIVGNKGALIMEGLVEQMAKIFHINMDAANGLASSIINNGFINAAQLKVKIDVKKDFWHFFSFPFDVDLTNGVEKDGSWIFREFDGMSRAENGAGNSWKDITGTKLEAGKGYIFRTNTAGPLTLTIDNPKFDHADAVAVLKECKKTVGETEPANKNWNFIGNLFSSYYDINSLDYSAPIMTWDGTKYVAYRPGDDDCVLTPFQGFFVQKPETGNTGVGFLKAGRTTYLKSQDPAARSASRRKAAARLDSSRKLVNLTVCSATDEEATADKARVVFNEKQTMDYELECDASKFISTENVPLIYSLDARGTRYAINERPMADGRVNLGFIAREDGQYTIAATRMDVPVVLIDNATGTTHDLNDGDYIFTADKGTYEQRFVLAVAEDYLTDGISTISTDEQGAAANIYDLQGKRVERQQQGVTIQNGKKVVSAM